MTTTGQHRCPERLGVLGGTFDPFHLGHLAAARAALEELQLDRLLLVVANEPWQKVAHRPVTPPDDRLALVAAGCAGVRGLEPSAIEIERGGPSYTIDTVEELLGQAAAAGGPKPEVFVVIGADLVTSLPTWHRAEELAHLVTVAVVGRPRSGAPKVSGWRLVEVRGTDVDVSASEVRRRLAQGLPVSDLLPPAVIRCIERRGLYAKGR